MPYTGYLQEWRLHAVGSRTKYGGETGGSDIRTPYRNIFNRPKNITKYLVLCSLIFITTEYIVFPVVSSFLDGRTGSQCMHRYIKSINPSIKRGKWDQEEDDVSRKFEIQYKFSSLSPMH